MRYLKGAMGRTLRTALAVALLLPAFAAPPSAMAVGGTIGFEADNPTTVPNDHTVFSFRMRPTGFASLGVYRVNARFMSSTTPNDTNDRGFLWNKATKKWVAFNAPWSEMPTVTMDVNGEIVGGDDGWLRVKFGDETQTWGTCYTQVTLQETSATAGTVSAYTPQTLVDMKTGGAWIHSIGLSALVDKRVEITQTVSPWTVYAVSQTETNGVDTDSNGVVDDASENIGGGAMDGDYRLAMPTTTTANYRLLVNRKTTGLPGAFQIPTADTDIALGASDVTAPTVPGGAAAAAGNASITVSWSAATDADSGIAGYRVYRWADAPAGAKYTPVKTLATETAAGVTSFTESSIPWGTKYNYEVRAVDASTNVSPRSATVAATATDTVAPTLTPVQGANTSAVSFTLTPNDGALGSGVKTIQYWFTGAATVATVTVNATTTVTAPAVTTVGASQLHWKVTDNAGNSSSSFVAFSVTSDTTTPTVTAALVGTNTANAQFGISATDAGRGVSGLQYKMWRTAPSLQTTATTVTVAGPSFATTIPVTTPGSYTVSYVASDAVGNTVTGTKTFEVYSADKVAPITTASGVPATWSKAATVTLTVAETESAPAVTFYRLNGGLTAQYSTALVFSTDGTQTLEYWSLDDAWPTPNKEATKTATIRIDKTAPAITVAGGGSSTATTTVTATVTDALSGVASTRYRVNGGVWTSGTAVTVSSVGTHTVEFEATDNAGNTATQIVDAVITAPTALTINGSATLVKYGAFVYYTGTLSTAASVDTSGVPVHLEYWTGSAWRPLAGTTVVTGPGGAYSIRVRPARLLTVRVAFDGAGALASSVSASKVIRVRAVVGIKSVPTQRANRTFTLQATLYPRHTGYVRFYIYKKVGSSYRFHRSYNVRSYSVFRKAVRLSAGTYRVRALHSDSLHYPSYSVYRTFRVR